MGKHYTSNTVSVAQWCNKCKKHTQHKVSSHRVGHCLECAEKLEKLHNEKPEPPAKQPEPPAKQEGFNFNG